MLVISRYAKTNFVDHTITDQSSILRFVEDNWSIGRIGNFSFDEKAGSLSNMFAFTHDHGGDNNGQDPQQSMRLILDPATGEPAGQ